MPGDQGIQPAMAFVQQRQIETRGGARDRES